MEAHVSAVIAEVGYGSYEQEEFTAKRVLVTSNLPLVKHTVNTSKASKKFTKGNSGESLDFIEKSSAVLPSLVQLFLVSERIPAQGSPKIPPIRRCKFKVRG